MEIKRNFNGTDAYMIERAGTIKVQLHTDLLRFTDFSSLFDNPYEINFKDALNAALEIGTNETVVDEQTGYTETVVAELVKCQKKYGEVKWFAEQAFPTSKARQNEFGTNDYQNVRKSQPQMVIFMTTMHKVATKYKQKLFDKGYTQLKIDEILTLRDALLDANTDQGVFINNRPVETSDRIVVLNTLYDFVTMVNSAAQVIFVDEEAKKDTYVYLPGSSTETKTKTGTGEPGINIVIELAYHPTRVYTFRNPSDIPLNFGLTDDNAVIKGLVVTVNPGEEKSYESKELFVGGVFVICQNINDTKGDYEVDYEV